MTRGWIIFTDLDGTLLDATDFSFAAAVPAIARLRDAGIPVIPVTSKTIAEIIPLAAQLGIAGPAIVESGGGIASFENGSWVVMPLGVPIEQIRARVPGIEARSGARLELFSTMSDADAERTSGLAGAALQRARQRQFDEPFILVEGELTRVARAAEEVGLVLREGARFHHLCGPVTKGEAVCRLLATFVERPRVIALGDAPMDGEFLVLADIPVIVSSRDGGPNAALLAAVPDAMVTNEPAPRGWSEAINAILDGAMRLTNEPARV